jgi:competence protein ComEC
VTAARRTALRHPRHVLLAARRMALRHPRHVLLAALVAGLLCSESPEAAIALAALGLVATLALRFAARPSPTADGAARATGASGWGTPAGLAAVATVGAVAGAGLGAARVAALDRTALRPLLGRSVSLRVTVLERPRAARRASSFPRPAWARGAGSPRGAAAALASIESGPGRGERIVVRADRWPVVRPGLEVALSGRLVELGPRDGWQRRRGAHARVFADRVRLTGGARGGLAGAIDRLRARAEASVSAGLDAPRAALARGMVLGEDEALSERTRDDFRASGLAHLVAASGQNVALLAALALPVLAALGLGLRGRLVGALALVALYVPLAGAGPSIQRAGVMGAAGLVAALAGRPASRAYALLLAAAVTLVLNPRAASDPGWQLSFAAVAAIALLAAPVAGRLAARGVARPVAEAGAITLAATLATAPLLALHFGRVSLVSLPANLLAAAAVAPVMWLGMLAIAAGLVVPPAATLIDALAQYPLAYIGWLAATAARVPSAAVRASLPAVAPVALAAALVLRRWAGDGGARWLRGPPGRRRSRAGVVVLGCTVVGALVLAPVGCGASAPRPPDPRDSSSPSSTSARATPRSSSTAGRPSWSTPDRPVARCCAGWTRPAWAASTSWW